MMGEGRQRVEPEHRPRALQRVQGPEYRSDKLAVVGRPFQIEQTLLKPLQQFLRFDTEDLYRIRIAHFANTLSTILTS